MSEENFDREQCAKNHTIPDEWLDKLDQEWVKIWQEHGRYQLRADEVLVERYRKDPAAFTFTYPLWAGPEVHKEEEIEVPVSNPEGKVKIRVYSPGGQGPFPVHINFHGGGWVLGNLETEAAFCRSLCSNVGIKVIDVDYRMGPESLFPTAIYDSWEVIKWVRSNAERLNISAARLSIGGLSSGGHLTAVLSHMARDEGVPLKLALMVVPPVDLRWCMAPEPLKTKNIAKYPSVRQMQHAPWGGLSRMEWFMDYWIPKGPIRDAAISDWRASPMLAQNFQNLPRTHIVTAEFDLLRDEGHQYGELLEANGVDVTAKCYSGMPHAFGHYLHPERGLSTSRQYLGDTLEMIREAHSL